MSGWANVDPSRFVREEHTPPARAVAPSPAPAHRASSPPQPAADIVRGSIPGIRERDYRGLPTTWASGLRRLNVMDMPRGARRERWVQVVTDAHRFAFGFHDIAIERGWSTETLFGFNTDDPFQDVAGLVFQIRGERVISLFKDDQGRSVAAIGKSVEQGCRLFYQRLIENAQLIWTTGSIG